MISIVIPVYNEEENIPKLYSRITNAATKWGDEYEVVIVDDGSSDASLRHLEIIHRRDPRWAVCQLRYFFIWPLGLMYLRKLLLGTKQRARKSYTVTVPPAPVNRLFAGISRTEQRLMRLGVHWPLGSSLLAVVERPQGLSLDAVTD